MQGFASEVYGDWKQTSKNNHVGAGGPASGSGSNINLTNKLTRGNNLNQINSQFSQDMMSSKGSQRSNINRSYSPTHYANVIKDKD